MTDNAISKLESLPNEILLETLQLENSHNLILTWYNLNTRLNSLIEQLHSIDLSSISYAYFLSYCSLLINRQHQVSSLKLSNVDSSEQISLFLSKFPLQNFHHLRSLSLIEVKQVEINEVILNLPSLNHLLYLLIDCHTTYYEEVLLNDITSTSLRSLTLKSTNAIHYNWSNVGRLCPNLESLNVNFFIYVDQLVQLLSSVPNSLKKLSIALRGDNNYSNIKPFNDLSLLNINTKIENLYISLGPDVSFSDFKLLIKQFKHLKKLSTEMSLPWNIRNTESSLNGYEWVQIISEHLPNLHTFSLRVETYKEHWNDQVSHSFNTDFWVKHRW
ncbi:unnamed protein product [Didymodactylos carnosus]|uniref:F-box domain-containing protein n=1 Tax=Didymodactylos carnosus TaxID=1234261 RepID=A0A813TW66_9BILA|nr:unnamed protein product [Didymodactylos carnosus]CAF3605655.1 unnamed protein product [Didymodactylos carnosus]